MLASITIICIYEAKRTDMIDKVIKGNENTTKLIAELKTAVKQYPPLTKDQEEKLIAQYRANRPKLNDLLFLHNMRLVFNIAKKYKSKTDDFDAMVQDGMLGLAIAAQNFDIERGTKFITYAMPWIKKKILERFYGKATEVIKRSVSLNSSAISSSSKSNDNEKVELEDYINEYIDKSVCQEKSIRQELSAIEQSEICTDLYNDLENDHSFNDIEKNVFIDIFANKEKTRDLTLKYDLTSREIASIKSKILSYMRNKLESKHGIHSFSDIYEA